jgi:hypothetical protein
MLSGIAYLLAMCKRPVGLSIPFCGGSVDSVWYRVVTVYPAAGDRHPASGAFSGAGTYGPCWSCALAGANAYYLDIISSYVHPAHSGARAYGFPVRCIQYLLLFL